MIKSKYDVFISYRREDGGDLANYFNSELNRHGFRTYIDIKELTIGIFPEELEKAIKNSDLILVVLTDGSLERIEDNSSYVRKELDIAYTNNKPLFIISKVENIYDKLEEKTNKIYGKLKKQNIIEYNHNQSNDVIEKLKSTLDKLKNKKFDFDNIICDDNKKDEGYKKFEFKGFLYNYKGELRCDIPYNNGILVDIVSDKRYEGQWFGWDYPGFSGKGKIYIDKKVVYEGQWRALKYFGKGKLYEDDGIYEGDFLDGYKNGQGKKIFNNGDYYIGEWHDSKISGHGEIRFNNGDHYIGQFSNNVIDGLGKYIYENGNKYDGNLLDGVPSGKGVMIYNTGYVIKGGFLQNKRHDEGELVNEVSKIIYKGKWSSDLFSEFGEFYYSNGMKYQGRWCSGIKYGSGVLMNSNGDVLYRGNWSRWDNTEIIDEIGLDLFKKLCYEECKILQNIGFKFNEDYNMEIINKTIDGC